MEDEMRAILLASALVLATNAADAACYTVTDSYGMSKRVCDAPTYTPTYTPSYTPQQSDYDWLVEQQQRQRDYETEKRLRDLEMKEDLRTIYGYDPLYP